ncbi:hypothetical protein [Paenibacillus mendelii]|uniref:Uncharacterized protein n=1 Tax=Paenibacillus mendelii TaxID=206163 RepID=A0ABV6JAS0_9BACL|nr:hypothetical protein [Paenibacillus mendelii]MCQ6563097.1 hypothetical protein [Paenibacillus mendelii]
MSITSFGDQGTGGVTFNLVQIGLMNLRDSYQPAGLLLPCAD